MWVLFQKRRPSIMATVEAATNTLTCIHFLRDIHIIFRIICPLAPVWPQKHNKQRIQCKFQECFIDEWMVGGLGRKSHYSDHWSRESKVSTVTLQSSLSWILKMLSCCPLENKFKGLVARICDFKLKSTLRLSLKSSLRSRLVTWGWLKLFWRFGGL